MNTTNYKYNNNRYLLKMFSMTIHIQYIGTGVLYFNNTIKIISIFYLSLPLVGEAYIPYVQRREYRGNNNLISMPCKYCTYVQLVQIFFDILLPNLSFLCYKLKINTIHKSS